jgi:cytoskeletal protein CcmA (bactofilin family)
MTIEGKVDGKIDLSEHNLTIGPKGRIQAEVSAKAVVVQGEITGNITATEKVELAETGRMSGDINAPRIIIADGARLKGSVDMPGVESDPRRQVASPRNSATDRRQATSSKTSASTSGTSVRTGRRSRPASP